MKIILLVGAALLFIARSDVKGAISDSCLRCICETAGCDSEIGKCNNETESLCCGPYQIQEVYWIDCGRPEGDYENCTKSKECSERCVQAYMTRYGEYCTGGQTPTCQDYARIHYGGPNGCADQSTVGYWDKVNQCLGRKGWRMD